MASSNAEMEVDTPESLVGDPASAPQVGGNDDDDDDVDDDEYDPLLEMPSDCVREGDHVILVFGDGKQVFAQATSAKGRKKRGSSGAGVSKSPPLKINKRTYSTAALVGMPYGTLLEFNLKGGLIPLPPGESITPAPPQFEGEDDGDDAVEDDEDNDGEGSDDDDEADDEDGQSASEKNKKRGRAASGKPKGSRGGGGGTTPPVPAQEQSRDNRHFVDDNTSQKLGQSELMALRQAGTAGSDIVKHIIQNSKTFDQKTDFSKAKYIARKQFKYQPRCRLVRCTAATLCQAVFLRDPRKVMNLREDTLGQILAYSNISAGCQVLLMETCVGLVTGAVAQRMAGYGKIISIYSGQQPAFNDMLDRYNLTFAEQFSIKWLHSGDIFEEKPKGVRIKDTSSSKTEAVGQQQVPPNEDQAEEEEDLEKADRELIEWPCPLQPHTRVYLEGMKTDQERREFLAKRAARFARKLTRHTPLEAKNFLTSKLSDSIILATKYDPTECLLSMLPYLAPSCPFVVYSEFIEPLTECFNELQKQNLAINLRLSDTWTREYQVLPGRTHPNMNMSQSGGFLLTGIKLDEETGHKELDEALIKEIREQIGGRRGKKPKRDANAAAAAVGSKPGNGNQKGKNSSALEPPTRDAKRPRISQNES